MGEKSAEQRLAHFGRSLDAGGALVAAAILLVIGFVGYSPIAMQEEAVVRGIETLREVSNQADGAKAKNRNLLRKSVQLEERYQAAVARIPDRANESDFLAQVTELASRSGLTLQGFRPGPIRTHGRYGEQDIGVTATGDYASACRLLEGLPRLSRFNHLISFEVDASGAENAKIPIEMQLRIFFNKPNASGATNDRIAGKVNT